MPLHEPFYFGAHFAPIIDLKTLDTAPKRFGYVLGLMRRALHKSHDDLAALILPGDEGGAALLRSWEAGSAEPNSEALDRLTTALSLTREDSHYLRNLLYGTPDGYDLTDENKQDVLAEFKKYKEDAYPTYLSDHYWTILDYSRGVRTLLALRKEEAEKLINTNMLSIVFDPHFNLLGTLFQGDDERWRMAAVGQINRFRHSTSHLRHHHRYMQTVCHLAEVGWRFEKLWNAPPLAASRDTIGSVVPSSPFRAEVRDVRYDGWASVRIVQWIL